MKAVNILNNESFLLLKNNDLLIPLIKKIVLNEALNKIVITDQEISELKDIFLKQNQLKGDDELKIWMKKNNIDENKLINLIKKPIQIAKFCEKEFKHRTHSHFLQRKADLDQAVYSLIRVKDPFLAKEIYHRISEKEASFEDLVNEFSEGLEKDTRGVIGPVAINQSHPLVSKILRSGKPGEIFSPVFIDPWWILIRVESKIDPALDERMEEAMSNELLELWLNEESQQIAKNLEKEFSASK